MNTTNAPDDESLAKDRAALQAYFDAFPFYKLMGMKLEEITPGHARLSISWREDLCQPAGIMHGGVLASLVDTAIAHSILLTPEYRAASQEHGGRMVSVDLRLKYLRPVSVGKVFCDARVVRLGRQVIHTEAVVSDVEGRQIALGDSMYMLVTGQQLQRREGD